MRFFFPLSLFTVSLVPPRFHFLFYFILFLRSIALSPTEKFRVRTAAPAITLVVLISSTSSHRCFKGHRKCAEHENILFHLCELMMASSIKAIAFLPFLADANRNAKSFACMWTRECDSNSTKKLKNRQRQTAKEEMRTKRWSGTNKRTNERRRRENKT